MDIQYNAIAYNGHLEIENSWEIALKIDRGILYPPLPPQFEDKANNANAVVASVSSYKTGRNKAILED